MKPDREEPPTGKILTRTFDAEGRIATETHCHGLLDIACNLEFTDGKKIAEIYFVKKQMVGRARYEKARTEYPDMPEADRTVSDRGAEMIKLANKEKKQAAAANKRRRENPLSAEQLQEAHRQRPFFQAAARSDVELLRQFLDAGEDPDAVAFGPGFTPLYSVCLAGTSAPDESLAAVRLLLDRGADPNKRLEYDSPISGRLDRGLTAMMVAPTADVAKTLLDAGAEVNVADNRGVTPLMRAAGSGRVDVVKVLLEGNADDKARSADGHSAADLARSKLNFFTDNIESCRREQSEERIHAYREILRLLNEQS